MTKVDKRKTSSNISILLSVLTRRCGDGGKRTRYSSLRHSPKGLMECESGAIYVGDTCSSCGAGFGGPTANWKHCGIVFHQVCGASSIKFPTHLMRHMNAY